MAKAADQLFQAGLLGTAAFRAGKVCSPAADGDFLEYLASLNSRRVGETPEGEAPALALIAVWLRHWKMASRSKSRPAQLRAA